jgi:radical SAM superfamily enzyme YgiQ (UPF0313 family)
MKICFLVPPNIHSIESSVPASLEEGKGFYPPLGMLYVAAAAEKWAGAEVSFIDCPAEGIGLIELEKIIVKLEADLIGVSVMTFNLLNVVRAAKMIKNIRPDIKIIVGGIHVSLYPLETLNLPSIDYIIAGEAEHSFIQLLEAIKNKAYDEFNIIKGLGYKNERREPCFNAELDVVTDLDKLPYPARHLLDVGRYRHLISAGKKCTTILSSRGCPYSCIFCDMRRTKFRVHSAEKVVDELQYLSDLGFDDFFFVDDTITVDKKRLIRICELIEKRNLNIRFKISARANTIQPNMITALKRAGCYRIHIGVESGTQRLLDYLQKDITIEQIKQAFRTIHNAGIETFAYCMVGIPTESESEMMETVNFAIKLKTRYAQFSICTPYPKTCLYNQMLADKIVPYDYWGQFASNPSVDFKLKFWNKDFRDDQLRDVQDRAHHHFYGRPIYLITELFRVRSWSDFIRRVRIGIKILTKKINK